MQYEKLTADQKKLRSFRMRRNRLVGELLAKDPLLGREDALRMAYQILDGRRRRRSRPVKKVDPQRRQCQACRRMVSPEICAWTPSRYICEDCWRKEKQSST